jgi:hypothetical protein
MKVKNFLALTGNKKEKMNCLRQALKAAKKSSYCSNY